jgi:hypothetical protein
MQSSGAIVTSNAEESMTSRFPVPWRIIELPTGFAVEDST